MKKALILTVLFGLFLVGCQDSNLTPVSPPSGNMSIASVPDNTPVTLDNIDFSSMKLNKWRGFYNRIYRASRHSILIKNRIWGPLGGTVTLNPISVLKSNGGSANISATLTFDKDAINSNTDVYMIIDPDDESITFYPDISQFNGNVKLDVTIVGADLSGLPNDPSQIDFVYVPDDPNADVQVINNNGISLDENTGLLGVTGAHLKHFSRYAWATRTGYYR